MILAFAERDGFADADNVADQAATKRHRARVGQLASLGRCVVPLQPAAQRLVHYFLEALVLLAPQSFERGRDVIVDGQCCSHAS